MIKFKTFVKYPTDKMETFEELVNKWLEEENPKAIVHSNMTVVSEDILKGNVYAVMIFYEPAKFNPCIGKPQANLNHFDPDPFSK